MLETQPSTETSQSSQTIELDLKVTNTQKWSAEEQLLGIKLNPQTIFTIKEESKSSSSSDESYEAVHDLMLKSQIENDKRMDAEEEDDAKNGGAILVHSLTNGKPNLEKFMDKLELAMDKCQDPEFMKQISEKFVDARRSKHYSRPTAPALDPRIWGMISNRSFT